MASKVPSRLKKARAHNARPYDRPNQGIIGRVASKVKDLLTPSWLFNSSWAKPSVEEDRFRPTISEDLTENDDDDEEEDETVEPNSRHPFIPLSNLHKRARYDCDIDVSSTSKPLGWQSPSTSERQFIDVDKDPLISTNSISKKDTSILNGDDCSENSDGSASTSGCSSLISSHQDRLNRSCGLRLSENALDRLRSEFRNKPTFQPRKDVSVSTDMSYKNLNSSHSRLSSWSCGVETPTKCSPKPRSIIHDSKPSFNISSFGGPSVVDYTTGKKISSPFYEGNTTFGGASACRKRQLLSTPYEINKSLHNKIKVKKNESSDFECMSSAAKRILHTLEKMSTPISDAKKIPNVQKSPVDISLSFIPTNRHYNSYSFSKKATSNLKGPPIVNLNTISKLTLLKNCSPKISRNSTMEIPMQRQSPVVKFNEVLNTASVPPAPTCGGKMRNKLNHRHISSKADDKVAMPEEYELPSVPLSVETLPKITFNSITSSVDSSKKEKQKVSDTKLQFTFASPIEYVPPDTVLTPQKAVDDRFTFSSPLVVNQKDEFHGASRKQSALEKESATVVCESVDDALKRMTENANKKLSRKNNHIDNFSDSNSFTKANEEKSVNKTTSSLEDKFKFQTNAWEARLCGTDSNSVNMENKVTQSHSSHNDDKSSFVQIQETESQASLKQPFLQPRDTWECDACMVKNPSSTTKCLSCETLKLSQQNTTGFSFKIKPAPGSWECSMCLVRNDEKTTKCAYCETPKPLSTKSISSSTKKAANFGDKFKPAPGSWECSSCMLRNSAEAVKCAACETPNSNKKENKSDDFGDRFKPLPGSWECSSCMLRNNAESVKCVACETPNPIKNGEEREKRKNGISEGKTEKNEKMASNSFSSSGLFTQTSEVWECKACKLNNPVDKKVCLSCKAARSENENNSALGSVTSENKFSSAATSSTVKFATATTSVSSPFISSFKFGVPASSSNVASTTSSPFVKFSSLSDSCQVSEPSVKCWVPSETTTKIGSSSEQFVFGGSSAPVTSVKSSIPSTSSQATTAVLGSVTSCPSIFTFSSKSENSFSGLSKDKVTAESAASTASKAEAVSSVTTALSSTAAGNTSSAFVFGASNVATTTAGPVLFKFGANSVVSTAASAGSDTSAKKPNLFNFGAGSNSDLKPTQDGFAFKMESGNNKDVCSSNTFKAFRQESTNPVSSASSVQSAPFKFGISNTTAASAGGFVFGAPKSDSIQTNTPFSFGSGPKSVDTPGFGGFSQNKPATSVATFGGFSQCQPTTTNFGGFSQCQPASTTAAPSFGGFSQVQPVSTVAAPSFGGLSQTQPATTAAMPSFGGLSQTQAAITAPSFGGLSQNQPATTVVAPSFGGFSQNPAVTTASAPTFSFGSNLATSTSGSSAGFKPSENMGMFSFGSKTTQNAVNSSNPAPVATPVFGCPNPQPVFGGSTTPAFGAVPDQKAKGGFNFGTAMSAAPASVFQFGATGGDKPVTNPLQSGFNFNVTPQPEANANFSSNFVINTPPSFNFGATSTPNTNQPFQFAANVEGSSSTPSAVQPRRIRKAVRRGMRKPD